jgi:hypothetical protein
LGDQTENGKGISRGNQIMKIHAARMLIQEAVWIVAE